MKQDPNPSERSLASRLREVCVGLRDDLDTTRHLFHGEPSYVLSDPLTFTSHRFDAADYDVIVRLRPNRRLSDVFKQLVKEGKAQQEDEDSFYRFIFSLHRMGFLSLPVSDEKLLIRRFHARRSAERKARWMGFLFLRIPLWNPNRFLDSTIRYVQPIFSPAFVCLWLILMVSAGYVIVTRWHDFWQPLNGVLAAANLPLLWVTLIALKVIHEFGHAYACKHYSLHVPEMGVFLIAGTPCAYVDATASWGLTQRYKRIIVGLAGMYFESIMAGIAVFVWSATTESIINAIAYRVIFLAGSVTVLFNINPLMRYDGYYIFSDAVNIPNLRARSTQYALARAKRWLLGIRPARAPHSFVERTVLLGYGLTAPIYKTTVLLAISAMIAMKMAWLGLSIGAYIILGRIYQIVKTLGTFLWKSRQTALVRVRAVALSIVLMIGVPGALLCLPIPGTIRAAGVVETQARTVVRADVAGFVEDVRAADGMFLQFGQPVVRLSNDELEQDLENARSALTEAQIRLESQQGTDPVAAAREQRRVEALEQNVRAFENKVGLLAIDTPAAGRFIAHVRPEDVGRFLKTGEEIGTIAAGPWQVRLVLSEDQFSELEPRAGTVAEFRLTGMPDRPLRATVSKVSPVGDKEIRSPALTHLGGGDIPVSPMTGQARRAYFEVTLTLDGLSVPAPTDPNLPPHADGARTAPEDPVAQLDPADVLRSGMTGQVFFKGRAVPVVIPMYRSLTRFLDSLQES